MNSRYSVYMPKRKQKNYNSLMCRLCVYNQKQHDVSRTVQDVMFNLHKASFVRQNRTLALSTCITRFTDSAHSTKTHVPENRPDYSIRVVSRVGLKRTVRIPLANATSCARILTEKYFYSTSEKIKIIMLTITILKRGNANAE